MVSKSTRHTSADKKRVKEPSVDLKLLEEFLINTLERKEEELKQVTSHIGFIKADLKEVQNQLQIDCHHAIDCSPGKPNSKKQKNGNERLIHGNDEKQQEGKFHKIINYMPNLIENYISFRKKPFNGTTELLGGLESFNITLSACAKYSSFKTIANLSSSDGFFNSASSIISSIEFDMNDEYFCTAGVSKKIKIYDYDLVAQPIPVMCNSITSRSSFHGDYLSEDLDDNMIYHDVNQPPFQRVFTFVINISIRSV